MQLKAITKIRRTTIIIAPNSDPGNKIIFQYINSFTKKYDFIKGFEGGYLKFDSIEKNKVSNSNLKIFDFTLTFCEVTAPMNLDIYVAIEVAIIAKIII